VSRFRDVRGKTLVCQLPPELAPARLAHKVPPTALGLGASQD
jgi:hypothetical protein